MRYVIVVCVITGLLIADGVYHDGYYLDQILRFLQHVISSVVGLVR